MLAESSSGAALHPGADCNGCYELKLSAQMVSKGICSLFKNCPFKTDLCRHSFTFDIAFVTVCTYIVCVLTVR